MSIRSDGSFSTENYKVFQSDRSGQAHLSAKNTTLADFTVVTDLNQIIYSCASADLCGRKSSLIDRGIRTNFNIITNFYSTHVPDLVMLALMESISKTIGTDDCA